MRVAVAADELTGVAEQLVDELRQRGHEPVLHGRLRAAGARRLGLGEILDAWLRTEASPAADDVANVDHLSRIERAAD